MPIYLDNHASTPLSAEAKDAMLGAWEFAANATSPHALGGRAADFLERARESVALLIDASPGEVIFTSGATEANNIALLGVGRALRSQRQFRNEIVVSGIEHKSVLEPAYMLEREGFRLKIVPVTRLGQVDVDALEEMIGPATLLVSVMSANNETGVIQPIPTIAAIARRKGALLHTDAAQAVGRIPVSVLEWGADYLSISSHKLHGPGGVGALFVSAGAPRPEPLQYGGGQESGLRSGTVPVGLAAGFGAAAQTASSRIMSDAAFTSELARIFLSELQTSGISFAELCPGALRLPGSLCFFIQDIDSEDIIQILSEKVCLSSGSACNSGHFGVSHVLKSLQVADEVARGVLRICFSRYNTLTEAQESASLIASAASRCLAAGGFHQ